MEVVFTIEPTCLNSAQLQVGLHDEDVSVNVTVQFSRVIILLRCDKRVIWWEGIRTDEGEE